MSKTFNFLILLLFVTFTVNAQETTLFDSQGNARAYIDYNDDATIYLWNGKAVAFLENDGVAQGISGPFVVAPIALESVTAD